MMSKKKFRVITGLIWLVLLLVGWLLGSLSMSTDREQNEKMVNR